MKKITFSLSIAFFICAIASIILVINFKRKTKSEDYVSTPVGNYDILIYNTEPSFNSVFNKIADEYGNSSGISVAFVNKTSDVMENFGNESPDIFMIKRFDELKVQRQYENVFDFYNASEKTFREIAEKIPDNLRLKLNDINNCGIPLTLRGFGFAVDQGLLSSIFGEEACKNILNDLTRCSFDDFKKFVENIKSTSVTLNGNEYKVNQEAIKNLDSVFLFPIDTSFPKLFNNLLVESFSGISNIMLSNDSSNMIGKVEKWMQMIDLITSHSKPSRGSTFISMKENSKSEAIKKFANGKSLFLIAEDGDYEEIKSQNADIAKNLVFIPIKAPFASNNTNSKITVYCPYYFVINSKSEKLKIAQDFLTWLISSPTAQKYLIQDLNFVLYNTIDSGTIANSLGRSSFNYFQCDSVIEPIFQVTKTSWMNNVTQFLTKKYLSSRQWNERYYKTFEDYCIKKWNDL